MNLKSVIFILLLSIAIPGLAQDSGSQNVEIFELNALQVGSTRTIRVYLPQGYENSLERYPVLYMHDAQNLFDTTTAFAGEWRVDEFLDSRKELKVIIVGIDHGDEKRIAELTPFPNEKYGGGEGDAYLNFLIHTLKPHIDNTYRSFPDAENTGIMGSSLGGLISFYAALKHPEVFGKVGVFSPSFWFSNEIYDFAEASEISPNFRIYILGGTAEDGFLIPNIRKMEELLLKKGLPKENMIVRIADGGEHNEAFWSREFPEAFLWLYSSK